MSIIILDSLIYIFLISYILSCLKAKDLNFPLADIKTWRPPAYPFPNPPKKE